MNQDPGNSLKKASKFSLRDGSRIFRDRLSRNDRDDLYRLNLRSSGQVDLSLSRLKANADLELYSLKQSNRQVLKDIGKLEFRPLKKRDIRDYLKREGKSRRGGKREESISESLEAGTYYIRVSSRRSNDKTRYRLKLSVDVESSEPNSNPGEDLGGNPGGNLGESSGGNPGENLGGNPDSDSDINNPGSNPDGNPGDENLGNNREFQQLWLKQFGSTQDDQAFTVASDDTGQDIYVAGSTGGSLSDDNRAINIDGFIRKYDSDGTEQWQRQFGGPERDFVDTIALDSNNNVYGVGTTNFSLPSGLDFGRSDAYLFQYDARGNLIFEETFDQGSLENGTGIALDSRDTVYISGQSQGFNLATLSIDFLPFINQYTSDGQFQTEVNPGFDSQGSAFRLLIDSSNHLYVAGIKDVSFSLTDPNNSIVGNVFVAKYDASGQNLWSQTLASADADFVNGIALDSSGNVYITGDTKGSLPENSNQGGTDAYLAKFGTNGDLLWVKQYGTSGDDSSTGIAIDANDMIYLVGGTDGNLFGNSNVGRFDGWLAKVDANGTVTDSTFIGTSENDRVNRISVDFEGSIYLAGETEGDLDGTNQGGLDAWVAKYSF